MKITIESDGIKWEAEFNSETIEDAIEYFGYGLMALTYSPELVRERLNLEDG